MAVTVRSLHIADADGAALDGGGAEIVFDATVTAARELGHEVAVMTATPNRTPWSYVYSRDNYRALARLLNDMQPDVVHLQNFYHFLSPSVLAAVRDYKKTRPDTRLIFTAHDFHLICPNSGFQHFVRGRAISYDINDPGFRWFHRFDGRSWAHSLLKLVQHVYAYRLFRLHEVIDAIISPSELIATALRNAGVTTPVHVLRNPIFVNPVALSNNREGLAFLGRLTPAKGLLQFASTLERLGIQCRLDVYGDGPQRDELVDFAGNSQFVHLALHGHVRHEDISSVLTRHKALIYPSTWLENAPLAVAEAALLGLALVVPYRGGTREIAELAEQHFFYDPDDAQSIKDAIREALASEAPNRLLDPSTFEFATYVRQLQRTYLTGKPRTHQRRHEQVAPTHRDSS